jgi:glyoxylase-like metal-dependent hydrolase (beta-lactamase superfamily II)
MNLFLLRGRDLLLIVKALTLGPLATNCFVAWCEGTREAIVIDPGFSTEKEGKETVLNVVETTDLFVKYIINTHGHTDHTSGNGVVKQVTGAPILIHELDAPLLRVSDEDWARAFGYQLRSPPADKMLSEGEMILFGKCTLTVLHTPGHTPGGISLVDDDCVFVGDTLFQGSIGRTDFPGGSYKMLIRSIREKLAVLPDNFVVYAGHGPTTTIREEKKGNPFLLAPEQYEPDEEN